MKKKKGNARHIQDMNTATLLIKRAPLSVLFQVYEINPATIAILKSRSLSHRQLVMTNKELKNFIDNPEVKQPYRYCPFCTSSRILQSFTNGFFIARCTTCNRTISFKEETTNE